MYIPQIDVAGDSIQSYINGYGVTESGATTPQLSVTLPDQFIPLSLAFGPTGKLYVGGGYVNSPGVILVYAAGATGDAQPMAVYTGGTAGTFHLPTYLHVNSTGRLFVVSDDGTLEVFDGHAHSGDRPVQCITTLATNNTFTLGIGADREGNIYVSDWSNQQIDVFARGATGDAAPMRTITGTTTNAFGFMQAITADEEGNVYLANFNPFDDPFNAVGLRPGVNSYLQHRTQALLAPAVPSAMAAPQATPMNANNAFPWASSGIYVFSAGASGNVAPRAYIGGTETGVFEPEDIAVDEVANIYYTDWHGGTPTALAFHAGAKGNTGPAASFTSADITSNEPPVELGIY
jgi:hypothetical protein